MGGAGLPGLLYLLGLVVVLALVVLLVIPWARDQTARRNRMVGADTESLEYAVPEGQDPAAVVAALQLDGFDAVTTSERGRQAVLIACPQGRDRSRAQARACIAHEANLNLDEDPAAEHQVRFTDE